MFAGLIALGLAGAVLFAAEAASDSSRTRHRSLDCSRRSFRLKTRGWPFNAPPRDAPNVLPIYGSSELTSPRRSGEGRTTFFAAAPTGFQLSPVGSGGANPLIMLQKVGALGSDLRGKKLAISLSPGWFLAPKPVGGSRLQGNFSLMAASEMVFGTALDFELKRDIASRMLECPSTLEKSPLLEFALTRLASGRWLDRVDFLRALADRKSADCRNGVAGSFRGAQLHSA